MKTRNLLMGIALIFSVIGVMAQTKTASTGKMNTYFVMSTHTPEQCMASMNDMKSMNEAFVSKFYFGCHHGDHSCYAFLTGSSEDAVRKMLPKNQQEGAKIMQVDKMTVAQLQKEHKEMK
jgi:hypothetical protein